MRLLGWGLGNGPGKSYLELLDSNGETLLTAHAYRSPEATIDPVTGKRSHKQPSFAFSYALTFGARGRIRAFSLPDEPVSSERFLAAAEAELKELAAALPERYRDRVRGLANLREELAQARADLSPRSPRLPRI